jgi:hypothetical protein
MFGTGGRAQNPEIVEARDSWRSRVEPALRRSVAEAERLITNHPEIQSWLQTAAFQAAMRMSSESDVVAGGEELVRLGDELARRFAPLVEAVSDVTEACGRLAVAWDPLAPQFSSLYIDFGLPYRPDLFFRLGNLDRLVIEAALQRLADALPASTPFPAHPNERTAVIVHVGKHLGARLTDRLLPDGHRRQSVRLADSDGRATESLEREEAVEAVHAYFSAGA